MARSDDDEVMVFRGPSAREFMAEHFGGEDDGDDGDDGTDEDEDTVEDEDGTLWKKVIKPAKKAPAKKAAAKKGAGGKYFSRP